MRRVADNFEKVPHLDLSGPNSCWSSLPGRPDGTNLQAEAADDREESDHDLSAGERMRFERMGFSALYGEFPFTVALPV